MTLTRFRLQSLFGEEWLTYETFVIKSIKQIGAEKLNLATLLPPLEANAVLASEAMEIIRKSEFTRHCDELDEKRDRLIGSTNNFVRSFLYEEDAALRDAAENLMIVIDHYAGMASENRDQESSRIINFVNELTENHAAQVAKLEGLEGRLSRLSAANAEYIKLQDDRTFSEAEKSAVRMVDVRREGDKFIHAIWNLTDVLLLSAPTPDIERFAAQLNVENQKERTKLAARKGRKEKE